jgi:hypothetical protein
MDALTRDGALDDEVLAIWRQPGTLDTIGAYLERTFGAK